MAFIDNMKEKLSQAGQTTMQKAKDLTDLAKLNSSISESEKKIRDLYEKIGYEIYNAYRDNPPEAIAALIGEINGLSDSIESARKQIHAINGTTACKQCGATVNKSMAFCGSCGCKVEHEQPAKTEAPAAFCSNCGSPVTGGSVFCSSCGGKIG